MSIRLVLGCVLVVGTVTSTTACVALPARQETAYCVGVHANGGTYVLKVDYDAEDRPPCDSMAKISEADFAALTLTQQCAKRQDAPSRTLRYFASPDTASIAAAQQMCATLAGVDVG